VHFRIDFVFETLSCDEETKIVTFRAKPDPRRYEWQTKDGKDFLYDKFDKLLFPEDVVAKFAENLKGYPINFEPQKAGDAEEYVQSRRSMIDRSLKGHGEQPTFSDPSREFLASLGPDTREFVVLSLDIVGSTTRATTTSAAEYARVIQTALLEFSEVVPLFHGHILKYTGDGIIAYFPAPSFITKNDLALDCALTLRRLVQNGLNPALTEHGYDSIHIRIGIDSGEAAVIAIGSPNTKQEQDIIGAVISLACKIQGHAEVDGIALGDVTVRNLHTAWRTICEQMNLGPDWKYADPETGQPYRVHRILFS